MIDRVPETIQPDVYGLRAWYMNQARQIEGNYGFSTSNFTIVSEADLFSLIADDDFDRDEAIEKVNESKIDLRSAHPDLVTYFGQVLGPHLPKLEEFADTLGGDRVIVRSSPLDEVHRRELSFAGAYRGYMPIKPGDRNSDLVDGTAAMLAGCFTRYGNAYYQSHQINGKRKVGAILMEPFMNLSTDVPLFYGTAYVHGDHIRNEYQVRPEPGVPQRDPQLHVVKGAQNWTRDKDIKLEKEANFLPRIVTALAGLQKHFMQSLDVEYLVDPLGDLYVVQVRGLTGRHLDSWKKIDVSTDFPAGGSAILNTIGTIEGTVMDMRTSKTFDVDSIGSDSIVIVKHESKDGVSSENIFTSLAKRKLVSAIKVVIDHSGSRKRDHLQYAIGENPKISFVTHIGEDAEQTEINDGDRIKILSNGLEPIIKKEA